ncbi:glycosyl transferase [Streptomyces mashuensis]|uniref:Glycosyl transferase n=1 Tax=Streptomyces mashuensis TaxID=33904 RepID=A0A919EDW9_9ACTN|nr:nucleotide disphospho-sugar-binding domain-containing protein [Streptomyces mashuensis]GHF52564.1 glycosyl transferase [Streptomyces mashuensis]
MRVLFVSYPAIGHVFPTVPLQWALRAAGHEVLVATGSYGLEVQNAGLHVADVAPGLELESFFQETVPDLLVRVRNPEGPDPMAGIQLFAHLNDHMTDGIVRTAEAFRPDLVVYEQIFVSGLIAAQKLGVPAVQHNFGFARGGDIRALTVSQLGATMARHGVTSLPEQVRTIDIAPPSMVEPEPLGWSVRPVPYNSGAVLPDWVLEKPDRPRIAVTLGTASVHVTGLGPVQRLIAAASSVDAEFVLALGEVDTSALGELPPNVRVVGWVPLTVLMQTCAGAVHHGGAGTTLAALNAGVPQIILPDGADRFVNAAAVQARGAGVSATAEELDVELVRRLLTDEAMRTAAAEVRDEIASMASPASLVAQLEELAAAGL